MSSLSESSAASATTSVDFESSAIEGQSVESTSIASSPVSTPSATLDLPTSTTADLRYDGEPTYPPMTTHWRVPSSCTWTYNADSMQSSGAQGAIAWLDIEPLSGASTLSCYPDGMFYEGRTGIFSPGTCPSGWTTVSLRVDTNEVRDQAITTAVCCSSEYTFEDNHCKRIVPTVLAVPIVYNRTARTHDVLSDSTTTLYSATIAVYPIKALFEEEDKDSLGLKDEDDIGNHGNKRSLSLGERIGIGVGVAVFVLLLLACAVFFVRRRDRAKAKKKHSHELGTIHRNSETDGHGPRDDYQSEHRLSHDGEPPPAYEPATETNSLTETASVATTVRDEEIRALRVQKAVIQRRIEELESPDGDHNRNQNQN